MSRRQDAVLACVEAARTSGVTVVDIGQRLHLADYSVKGAMGALKTWGLVKVIGKQHVGRGRRTVYARTELAINDVLTAFLRPGLIPGKGDKTVSTEPLREWINDLIARERRALLYSTVADYRSGHDPSKDKMPESIVRRRLGLDARTMHRILHSQATLSFGLADRILTKGNGPSAAELWPECKQATERGIPEEDVQRIVALRGRGLTILQIAARMHWSRTTVQRVLREAGVTQRSLAA